MSAEDERCSTESTLKRRMYPLGSTYARRSRRTRAQRDHGKLYKTRVFVVISFIVIGLAFSLLYSAAKRDIAYHRRPSVLKAECKQMYYYAALTRKYITMVKGDANTLQMYNAIIRADTSTVTAHGVITSTRPDNATIDAALSADLSASVFGDPMKLRGAFSQFQKEQALITGCNPPWVPNQALVSNALGLATDATNAYDALPISDSTGG